LAAHLCVATPHRGDHHHVACFSGTAVVEVSESGSGWRNRSLLILPQLGSREGCSGLCGAPGKFTQLKCPVTKSEPQLCRRVALGWL
jgi:hypothetical protein